MFDSSLGPASASNIEGEGDGVSRKQQVEKTQEVLQKIHPRMI
jgi:hypothetical protein